MTPTFHLLGLPTDSNSSFERGPALAPPAIRAALWSQRGNLACADGLELGTDFHFDDQGDLPLAEAPADHAEIVRGVTTSLTAGAVPLVLGGDHSVTWPILEAIHARHGPVDLLHFDAHPDLYADFEGNPRSHASPFARIMERGLARRLVQVGVRTLNQHCRDQAAGFGVEVIPMANFTPAAVPILNGPLYISLDLDGIDPAEAPGVSHPEPGGLTVREVLAVLRRQTAPIIGADLVEYNPRFDSHDRTAIVAATLLKELAALAVRNSSADAAALVPIGLAT